MIIYYIPILILFIFCFIFYLTFFLSKTMKTGLKEYLLQAIIQSQQTQNEALNQGLLRIQDALRDNIRESDRQIKDTLERSQASLSVQFDKLNLTTQQNLQNISLTVEERLAKGLEKTNITFTNIIERLAIIDDAQKKITELSTNVVSLKEILHDKRSRGAFGEIQLNALIHNVIPAQNFALQHTLTNGNRVDCMLFLPPPTGNIAIDAKFPLENFQIFTNFNSSVEQRTQARQQFRQDIKKHIQAISEKYIIPGQTSDGALMFIPAEAVFSEIHAHFPDLVEQAQKARVWLASPTTLMAILTTASAVIKDCATRKQVHIIQEHLAHLAMDFSRFEKRMDSLTKHIKQVNSDAEEVHTSARKISNRFSKIEKVEIEKIEIDSQCPAAVELEDQES